MIDYSYSLGIRFDTGQQNSRTHHDEAVADMRIRHINVHCVCIDLVGRVITIRFAYKGMHQEGNKSGAHRESICFHLHGRPARIGRRGGMNTRWEGTQGR